jgi:hypothetical protein
MKTINSQDLSNVSGGKKDDSVLKAVTDLQSSIKDIASSKNNQQDPTMFMMMAMMMNRSSGPTVVAAAPAASPVINVSTRVRRGW